MNKLSIYELIRAGLTPTEAVDYIEIEQEGCGIQLWARLRGVQENTVNNNVINAKDKLWNAGMGRKYISSDGGVDD